LFDRLSLTPQFAALCQQAWLFKNTEILQGIVATHVRRGIMFNNDFIGNY